MSCYELFLLLEILRLDADKTLMELQKRSAGGDEKLIIKPISRFFISLNMYKP